MSLIFKYNLRTKSMINILGILIFFTLVVKNSGKNVAIKATNRIKTLTSLNVLWKFFTKYVQRANVFLFPFYLTTLLCYIDLNVAPSVKFSALKIRTLNKLI